MMTRVASVAVTAVLFGGWVCAQTAGSAPSKSAPSKSADIPRTPDGKPDFSGVWTHRGLLWIPAPKDLPPFQPGGEARFNAKHAPNDDPAGLKCLPVGMPRQIFAPYPAQFLMTPCLVTILYEYEHFFRVIPTDGREHPKDLMETWMGNSVGKWEGDTLVVDTVGMLGDTWIDTTGHGHSDAIHVIERYTMRDAQTISREVTIDDPKIFTKPFTVTHDMTLHPGWELLEFICEENNREGLKGKYQ